MRLMEQLRHEAKKTIDSMTAMVNRIRGRELVGPERIGIVVQTNGQHGDIYQLGSTQHTLWRGTSQGIPPVSSHCADAMTIDGRPEHPYTISTSGEHAGVTPILDDVGDGTGLLGGDVLQPIAGCPCTTRTDLAA